MVVDDRLLSRCGRVHSQLGGLRDQPLSVGKHGPELYRRFLGLVFDERVRLVSQSLAFSDLLSSNHEQFAQQVTRA